MKIVLEEKDYLQIIADYFYTDVQNVELILYDNNSDTADIELEISDEFIFKKINHNKEKK